MKKLVILSLVLLLSLGGVQAQNKKSNTKTNSTTLGNNNQNTMVDVPLTAIQLPDPMMGLDASLDECLHKRITTRNIRPDEMPMELISSLLWSTYGYNRMEEGKRVVPSARNVQEFDIYVFSAQGVYRYEAKANRLEPVFKGDVRAKIADQKHFAIAPISIVIVANYDRMKDFKKTEDRDFYAAVDCGYLSENIYLFCASAGLGTVACGGIDREAIAKVLGLKNGKAILAHPVGLR